MQEMEGHLRGSVWLEMRRRKESRGQLRPAVTPFVSLEREAEACRITLEFRAWRDSSLQTQPEPALSGNLRLWGHAVAVRGSTAPAGQLGLAARERGRRGILCSTSSLCNCPELWARACLLAPCTPQFCGKTEKTSDHATFNKKQATNFWKAKPVLLPSQPFPHLPSLHLPPSG